MMDYGMGWGIGWIGGILFWIIPFVLLFVGIKYLISGGGGGGASESAPSEPTRPGRALSMLEERYAKGEINRDEFLQKRDDILGK